MPMLISTTRCQLNWIGFTSGQNFVRTQMASMITAIAMGIHK
jgi:hypothetical protein